MGFFWWEYILGRLLGHLKENVKEFCNFGAPKFFEIFEIIKKKTREAQEISKISKIFVSPEIFENFKNLGNIKNFGNFKNLTAWSLRRGWGRMQALPKLCSKPRGRQQFLYKPVVNLRQALPKPFPKTA